MNKSNDNRMAWIRNIDKLKESNNGSYFIEHEVATECHIPGVLDYDGGKILCAGLTMAKNKNGLYHYSIRIQHSKSEEPYYNKKANKKGYYFRDGIIGELLSLFSLYLQCRFYLTATYSGELSSKGLKTKIEHNFLYRPCNHQIHPKIFENNKSRNFAIGLSDFLNSVKTFKPKQHQQFILSCYHYAKAIKEVGIDREMVFIRLVSSAEVLAKNIVLTQRDNSLLGKKFSDIFKNCNLCKNQKEQLKEILKIGKDGLINIEKSRLKFISFIKKYSKGCLKGGNWKAKDLKISRKDLPKALRKIYDARSGYLHNGEPMCLSLFWKRAKGWDTDPSLGMLVDNRRISVTKKLPYEYWFENIIRCCLLNYLTDNQN